MSEATPFGQGCTLCAEDMAAAIIRYKREGQAIPLQTGMISPPQYCPACGRALTREKQCEQRERRAGHERACALEEAVQPGLPGRLRL